ncbi:hypothetical protein VTK56DRAFT_1573 [Thermocarpiscus australiensis]
MPILCHPGKGEILPPTAERIMRVNVSRSFSLDSSAEVPSHIPPTHHCFKESWDLLATYCKDLTKCQAVISKMCCDALTDSQSFCIRQIERASNAYYVGVGYCLSGNNEVASANCLTGNNEVASANDVCLAGGEAGSEVCLAGNEVAVAADVCLTSNEVASTKGISPRRRP